VLCVFFHWHNPSRRTMALESNQHLTKWVQGLFPGGKGGRCVWPTTLPPLYADCLEIWEPQPPGTLRACPGLYRDCFLLAYQVLPTYIHSHSTVTPLQFTSGNVHTNCGVELQILCRRNGSHHDVSAFSWVRDCIVVLAE